MKVIQLQCPSCGANLEIDKKRAFCPYCGTKLLIDDESLNINVTYTKRDEARIKENESKEKIHLTKLNYKERAEKRNIKIALLCGIGIPVFIIISTLLGFTINKGVAKQQGKISAGYYKDYVGQNYEAVVTQMEELGFNNIVTVDLEDSGLAFWNNNTVESISIDGNSAFESINYFYSDDKVIITHH